MHLNALLNFFFLPPSSTHKKSFSFDFIFLHVHYPSNLPSCMSEFVLRNFTLELELLFFLRILRGKEILSIFMKFLSLSRILDIKSTVHRRPTKPHQINRQ